MHWQDTARSVRFFFFDARLVLCLCIWFAHMCEETFCIAFLGMAFFGAIELLGISPMAALRYAKGFCFGSLRPIELPYWTVRRIV